MASMHDLDCDSNGVAVGRYRLVHRGGMNGSVGPLLQFQNGHCTVDATPEVTAAIRGAIAALGDDLSITRIDVPAEPTEPEEVDWAELEPEAEAEPESGEETSPAIAAPKKKRRQHHK